MMVSEFILCSAAMKSRLNQLDVDTSYILKLFSKVLPKPNNCPATYYKYKKYFNHIDDVIIKKHYYCPNCNASETNTDNDVNNGESIDVE